MKIMLALPMLALTACATIIQGPNETIVVRSQPPGAAASIKCDGGVNITGTTPVRLSIPRRADGCVVEASAAGRAKSVPLHRGLSGMYWVNFAGTSAILVGAVAALGNRGEDAINAGFVAGAGLTGVGFLIDSLTGSMYDRDVHDVMVDLEH